ncbi:Ppx/GppA phosphatase family protein [Robiginitalea aurantiaca]|uniref:Exopolyphosphatase n=1 Tax=Robiginitalea aurantiaca TaxID=3056915 RepID=A0ABT7WI21_9FLAO|nr:exopolyphosphatase [Robiginitalea aurantiaca]MDM9632454.1 exopolyphosphatase [Robiginitalea aurantiaca]
MKVRKYAAIDIGSNAMRLLVHNIVETPQRPVQFFKNALVRVPVRLGEDSFGIGTISEENVRRIVKTLKAFLLLIEVSGVEKYRACATSALREAANGPEITERIFKETGMEVELIDGQEEASIIAGTDLAQLIQQDANYLYVDVGGGSTEFTVFSGGEPVLSRSFQIGTVRLIKELVAEAEWKELREWIQGATAGRPKLSIIGSGGNINKLHKMSGRKIGQPLSYIWLNAQYHFLESMTYDERISELGLNPDRADVILPATQIFLLTAKWSGVKKIHVPQIGLADGIIRDLYFREMGY